MIINRALTMFRCEMNRIHLDTSMTTLFEQTKTLEKTLSTEITFADVKKALNDAMEGTDFDGFKAELENLMRKDEVMRGHDYLKLWFKTYFVMAYGANFIIADTASHNMLQNRLSYEQKNELLHMMRGRKHD